MNNKSLLKVSSSKQKNILNLTIFTFSASLVFVCPVLSIVNTNSLLEITKKCLNQSGKANCTKALIGLETLQIKESDRENYSCQTRILALQANVIIMMQELSKRVSYSQIIKEVEEHCFSED